MEFLDAFWKEYIFYFSAASLLPVRLSVFGLPSFGSVHQMQLILKFFYLQPTHSSS
jgi:hypothetical protein